MPDTRLKDAANAILTNLAAALEAEGIDVPDRRYVHVGQAAHDFAGARCVEAFIVSWIGTLQGLVGAQGQAAIRCAMPLTHQFQILLLRCVPTLKDTGATYMAPSAAELQASGEEVQTDAMTLGATIVDLVLDGAFVNSLVEDIVSIDSVVAIGPLGGVGGSLVNLSVTLLDTP